jgi:hypothetical protein
MSSENALCRLALALLLAAAGGCADLDRGPAPPVPDACPDTGGTSDGGGPPFARVKPLVDDGCRRCHAPGQMAGDTGLLLTGDAAAEYTAVSRFVDVATPTHSRLLAKASGQGHGGGTIYRTPSPEYAALLAWIAGGANP